MHIQVIRRSVSKPLTAASIVSLYILPLLFYLPHIFVFSLYIFSHLLSSSYICIFFIYSTTSFYLPPIFFWIYCSLKVSLSLLRLLPFYSHHPRPTALYVSSLCPILFNLFPLHFPFFCYIFILLLQFISTVFAFFDAYILLLFQPYFSSSYLSFLLTIFLTVFLFFLSFFSLDYLSYFSLKG